MEALKVQVVYLYLILEDKIIYHADNLKFRVREIPKKQHAERHNDTESFLGSSLEENQ
jgi:hypothetical protein